MLEPSEEDNCAITSIEVALDVDLLLTTNKQNFLGVDSIIILDHIVKLQRKTFGKFLQL